MVYCVAINCRNSSKIKRVGISFHKFPNVVSLREEWMKFCNRPDWAPSSNSRLCSYHFSEDAFIRGKKHVFLKSTAVPTIKSIFEGTNNQRWSEKKGPVFDVNVAVGTSTSTKNVSLPLPSVDVPKTSPLISLDVPGTSSSNIPETSSSVAVPGTSSSIVPETSTSVTVSGTSSSIVPETSTSVAVSGTSSSIVPETSTSSSVALISSSSDVELAMDREYNTNSSVSEDSEDTPSKVKLKRQLKAQENKLLTALKKIKVLQQDKRRLTKKIKNVIEALQEQNLLTEEVSTMLQGISKTSLSLRSRQNEKALNPRLKKEYDERLIVFSITLYYLSPKAYNFVRDTFDTCLPHPNTICSWYRTVNAEPGISSEVLEMITKFANAEHTIADV